MCCKKCPAGRCFERLPRVWRGRWCMVTSPALGPSWVNANAGNSNRANSPAGGYWKSPVLSPKAGSVASLLTLSGHAPRLLGIAAGESRPTCETKGTPEGLPVRVRSAPRPRYMATRLKGVVMGREGEGGKMSAALRAETDRFPFFLRAQVSGGGGTPGG